MESDPPLLRAELIAFGHFGLAFDLVTERPRLDLVGETDFLDAVYLRVLYFEPTDFASDPLLFAVAVLEAHFGQTERPRQARDFCWRCSGRHVDEKTRRQIQGQRLKLVLIVGEAPFERSDAVVERDRLRVLQLGPVRHCLATFNGAEHWQHFEAVFRRRLVTPNLRDGQTCRLLRLRRRSDRR